MSSLFPQRELKKKRDYLAALDIGASKVCCSIARLAPTSTEKKPVLEVLGLGQQISQGLKNGRIIDLEALEDSIVNAVHAAEQQADVTLEEVMVSLPALCLTSSYTSTRLLLSNQPVDRDHLRRLMNLDGINLGSGTYIVHALPLGYWVDDVQDIRDPTGLAGEQLGVKLHLITAPRALIRNLTNCIGRCHLGVAGFVAAPYAAGLATLVDDEIELGVTLVDLGGGGTSLALFAQGQLYGISHVPLGGIHVTYDIARGLSTPVAQAERLKTLYGSVFAATEDRETILVPLLGEDRTAQINQVPKTFLSEIIRARVEEIFQLLQQKMEPQTNLMHQRVVITGGGSHLGGIRDYLATLWGRPIRLGVPRAVQGHWGIDENPSLAANVGLLRYAIQDMHDGQDMALLAHQSRNIFSRMIGWVKENL